MDSLGPSPKCWLRSKALPSRCHKWQMAKAYYRACLLQKEPRLVVDGEWEMKAPQHTWLRLAPERARRASVYVLYFFRCVLSSAIRCLETPRKGSNLHIARYVDFPTPTCRRRPGAPDHLLLVLLICSRISNVPMRYVWAQGTYRHTSIMYGRVSTQERTVSCASCSSA